MKRGLLALALVAFLVAAALLIRDYLVVDRCLDAGGRWSSERKACEFG